MGSKDLPGTITASQLAAALSTRSDIRLLDVRTPAEFDRAHVERAYNVPLGEIDEYAPAIGCVSAPIVVVCRSGTRARVAEQALRRAGARSLHILDGGMLAWRAARLPVNRQPISATALARRVLGIVAMVVAIVATRENAFAAVVLAFLGLRLAFGMSILPCAAAGICSVPRARTNSIVEALVQGRSIGACDSADEAGVGSRVAGESAPG